MSKDFIKQRNAEINFAKEITRQCDCDALAIVLNNPKIMGHNVMGKERIVKVLLAWMEQANEVSKVCSTHPERDYLIETLDRRLRQIFGDDLAPFNERYPGVAVPKTVKG